MTAKLCPGCNEEKSIEQFALRNKNSHLRQSYCMDCEAGMKSEWYMEHREEQVRAGMKRRDQYKQILREYVWNYLSTHPCISCGETDPAALEFHHVRGEKVKEVSNILKNGAALQTLVTEIEKCDVLCANCHRKLTAKKQKWYEIK